MKLMSVLWNELKVCSIPSQHCILEPLHLRVNEPNQLVDVSRNERKRKVALYPQ